MALRRTSARSAASARTNGAKSSGPITPEGLRKSRMAGYKHGFYARDENRQPIFEATFIDDLRRGLYDDIKPVGAEQNLLFNAYFESFIAFMEARERLSIHLHQLAETIAREMPEGTSQGKINLLAEAHTARRKATGELLYRAVHRECNRMLNRREDLYRSQKRAAKLARTEVAAKTAA